MDSGYDVLEWKRLIATGTNMIAISILLYTITRGVCTHDACRNERALRHLTASVGTKKTQ